MNRNENVQNQKVQPREGKINNIDHCTIKVNVNKYLRINEVNYLSNLDKKKVQYFNLKSRNFFSKKVSSTFLPLLLLFRHIEIRLVTYFFF